MLKSCVAFWYWAVAVSVGRSLMICLLLPAHLGSHQAIHPNPADNGYAQRMAPGSDATASVFVNAGPLQTGH
jgi:hypothetical protein